MFQFIMLLAFMNHVNYEDMNVPEFDPAPYKTLKETFGNAPEKCMYDIYDENGRIIGVSKLYRRR